MPGKHVRRWTPLLVVGTLLIVFGGGLAAVVGPDDTVRIGTHTAPYSAAGQAVVTHPEVTAFRNVGMLVEASAPGGVFLATTRRVDTQSLLEGTERYEIGRVAWGTVGGHMRLDGAPATFDSLGPTAIVGWKSLSPALRRLEDGTVDPDLPEKADLVVELDGTPIDVVIIPKEADARVTLSLGAHVEHLFVLQIAVAWTGALLILVWWILRVRRRRAPRRARSADQAADHTTDSATDSVRDQPRGHTTRLPSYPHATASTTPRPEPPPTPPQPQPQPQPQQAERAQLHAEQPLGEVSRSAESRPVDSPRLPHAITLPILAILLLGLALAGCATPSTVSARDARPSGPPLTLTDAELVTDGTPQEIYAPTFTTYPMWAAVHLPPKDSQGAGRLQLLTRTSFREPWLPAGTVRLGTLPPENTRYPTEVSKVILKEAGVTAAEIADFWATGRSGEARIGKSTKRARTALIDSGVRSDQIWVTGGSDDQLHVMSVEGGHLVLVRQVLTSTSRSGAVQQRSLTSAALISPGTQTVVLGSTVKPAG